MSWHKCNILACIANAVGLSVGSSDVALIVILLTVTFHNTSIEILHASCFNGITPMSLWVQHAKVVSYLLHMVFFMATVCCTQFQSYLKYCDHTIVDEK